MKKLTDCIYYSTSSFNRFITDYTDKVFKTKYGMSTSHAIMLIALAINEERNLKCLAKTLNLSHSTVSRHVDYHENIGYVVKMKEGKEVFIGVTEKANSIIPDIYETWKEVNEHIESVIGMTLFGKIVDGSNKGFKKLQKKIEEF